MTHPAVAKDLNDWLIYIENLHPKSIAMGLDRVKQVIARLQLHPQFIVITVAGTNGKGSTCAMLENIYRSAGYKVGCYTSPHLIRYNERVRVDGAEVDDAALCEAFAAVNAARDSDSGAVALTYFEVGTLAAVWHFMRAQVEVAILEVGLGGRLDAVNAFDPDCAIVTSIDLDHMEFLGDTREKIGLEKAGVYRTKTPAICGDKDAPLSLVNHAHSIQADFRQINRDFQHQMLPFGWQFIAQDFMKQGKVKFDLPLPMLAGNYQLDNAACAIAAVESLQQRLPVRVDAMINAMLTTQVAGRFQKVAERPTVILDVAHNPHAARALAGNLAASKTEARTLAVFAMLADKDIHGVINALKQQIDVWYVADIDHVRGAKASELKAALRKADVDNECKTFDSAAKAYAQACLDAAENDKIVVFGSFFTVSNVMQTFLQRNQ